MTCQNKDAKFIFDSIEFEWKSFFSAIPEDATVLATNRANDPISIMVPYEKGYCIFLPYTYEQEKLFRLLAEKGLNIIPPERVEETITAEMPPWATESMTENEVKLVEIQSRVTKKLGKYNRFKPLLWETGDSLQKLVIDAFGEIGITVTELPKDSHGDFEFPIQEDLIGVCEVKGLLGNGDRRNLRQLLDYFIEQKEIEKRNVKGVFIVNHFRNESPDKRGEPVTLDAKDLVETYDFSVFTTMQLYDSLIDFWENKLTKEDFLKKFQKNNPCS